MRSSWPLAVLLLATPFACGDDATPAAGSDTTSTDGDGSASSSTGDDGDPMIPPRPDTQACRFDGQAPGLLPPLELAPVFADESLADVIDVAPAGDRVIVAERSGRLLAGTAAEGTLAPVVDVGERGEVVAIAAAPDFAASGHVFVRYEAAGGAPRTVIARLTIDLETWTAELASERIVMEVADAVGDRSGGALVFDASGMLVIGVGDLGGGASAGEAQDPRSRVGKLLRVDVGPLDDTGAFAIPADNPFIGDGGDADEVWAVGLRDPWRCTVADAETLWCVDIGAFEQEVDRVGAGANLGWWHVEGTSCQLASGDCSDLDVQPPSAVYRSGDGDCGIAGVLFGVAGLDATLVYADRCSGRLRGIDTADPGGVVQDEILGEELEGIVALARDAAGEALAITGDARIARIVSAPPPGEFPVQLGQSGCFADLVALAPVPGVVPYGVNAQLWTDGAIKDRFIALPPTATIDVDEAGELTFPIGTVLLKTFSFELVVGDPESQRAVETRVMVLREHGWQFHSYRWNDAGTDAELLAGGATAMLAIEDAGETIEFEYMWPSRGNCKVCHGLGSSRALGPRVDQLNGEHDYGEASANQLLVLDSLGMFTQSLAAPETLPRIPGPADPDASLEERARGYLHTNCSHCHRPGGWTPPDLTMDLRWSAALVDTKICDVDVQYYNPWVTGTKRIAPGDPDASVIWERVQQRGPGQMPPLATSRIDPHASVLRDWIAQLQTCP